jgi:hypothetical protein
MVRRRLSVCTARVVLTFGILAAMVLPAWAAERVIPWRFVGVEVWDLGFGSEYPPSLLSELEGGFDVVVDGADVTLRHVTFSMPGGEIFADGLLKPLSRSSIGRSTEGYKECTWVIGADDVPEEVCVVGGVSSWSIRFGGDFTESRAMIPVTGGFGHNCDDIDCYFAFDTQVLAKGFIVQVPEPTTIALWATGLALLPFTRRRVASQRVGQTPP